MLIILKLQKRNLTIREFKESDIELKLKWINDPENNFFLHYNIPLNSEDTFKWYENKDNTIRLDCVIEYDNNRVGLIGLLNINKTDCKAEFYITIGEHNYKNKGIATSSSILILEYAFKKLGINKVYLNVDFDNEPAIRLYEKLGFEKEGHFKEDIFRKSDNQLIDRCRYAIMRQEFLKNYRRFN